MKLHIPIRLPSLANLSHLHWRRITKIKNEQKLAVAVVLGDARVEIPPPPYLIRITRIGPRKLDGDNLHSSAKYVRDAIAAKIGIDDGSDQYVWEYAQRIGPYGVDVEITSR